MCILRKDKFLCGCMHMYWAKCSEGRAEKQKLPSRFGITARKLPSGMGCGDLQDLQSRERSHVVSRKFCCSVVCCFNDESIKKHVEDVEKFKKNITFYEFLEPAEQAHDAESKARIDWQLRRARARGQKEAFERLKKLKDQFDQREFPKDHAICVHSYRVRLELLLQPYSGGEMDEDATKRWEYMMWPSANQYADKDLHEGRPPGIPIVEDLCKCNCGKGCQIQGDGANQ